MANQRNRELLPVLMENLWEDTILKKVYVKPLDSLEPTTVPETTVTTTENYDEDSDEDSDDEYENAEENEDFDEENGENEE